MSDRENEREIEGVYVVEKQDLLLAPTHEEVVTQLVSQSNLSSKHLPLYLYQMTNKFRKEKRPKGGLLRTREFLMKDMYTFDTDDEAAKKTYMNVCNAYEKLFEKLELPAIKVLADTGSIGGLLSHEFHVISDVGEDVILHCNSCDMNVNTESLKQNIESLKQNIESLKQDTESLKQDTKSCPNCQAVLQERKGIEVGHAFLLGDRYSLPFDANYMTTNGKKSLLSMGCFGIGVTRLLSTCIEVLSTDKGMRWPALIAPFDVALISPKEGSKEEAVIGGTNGFLKDFALEMSRRGRIHVDETPGLDVLFDDRNNLTVGKRDKDHLMRGIPYLVIAGKSVMEGTNGVMRFEVIRTRDGNKWFLTHEQTLAFLDQVFCS